MPLPFARAEPRRYDVPRHGWTIVAWLPIGRGRRCGPTECFMAFCNHSRRSSRLDGVQCVHLKRPILWLANLKVQSATAFDFAIRLADSEAIHLSQLAPISGMVAHDDVQVISNTVARHGMTEQGQFNNEIGGSWKRTAYTCSLSSFITSLIVFPTQFADCELVPNRSRSTPRQLLSSSPKTNGDMVSANANTITFLVSSP